MSGPRNDWLLTAARIVILLFRITTVVGMVAIGVGIGALLTIGRGHAYARLAAVDAPPLAYWIMLGTFALLVLMLYLGWRFFGELGGIVRSVGEGDPFRPDNAVRLARMGWIVLGAQAIALPLAAALRWFKPYLERAGEHVRLELGLDGSSILLILILFILARVFKHGAAMRDELEGTV